MKRILYILFFISIGTTYAQQDAMFTYYMFNHQAVNPAYVGSRQIINGTMLNRSQWTGFVGAPWSHTVSLNMPLLNKTMGFGASFSNETEKRNKLNIQSDIKGRIKKMKNVHFIDSSVLPVLAPGPITFIVMLNAYRITEEAISETKI